MSSTRVLIAAFFVWAVGFFWAGCWYYAIYRRVMPNLGRTVASMFWPVGIPLDWLFVVKRWPQKKFGR